MTYDIDIQRVVVITSTHIDLFLLNRLSCQRKLHLLALVQLQNILVYATDSCSLFGYFSVVFMFYFVLFLQQFAGCFAIITSFFHYALTYFLSIPL